MERKEKERSLLCFDPEDAVVGTLHTGEMELEDGWNKVARAEDSGTQLWGAASDGTVFCWRATDQDGNLVTTVDVYVVDPPKEDISVKPAVDPADPNAVPPSDICLGAPRGLEWGADGGTDGGSSGAYLCAALSDGGQICWK